MKKTLVNTAIASLLLASGAASAAAGSFAVNIGFGTVAPETNSNYLNTVETVAGLPSDSTSTDVNSNTQLALTFNYYLTDSVAFELWTASPFTHEIEVKSSSSVVNGLTAGETKHLPPTLLAQYHFFDGSAKLRPFVGAGINATIFFEEEVNSLDGAFTDLGLIGADDKLSLDLDTSYGLALQAGVNYKIDNKWGIHAMAAWADISADGYVKLNGEDLQKVEVELDPIVFILAARYKF